jgi:hypothetical protein
VFLAASSAVVPCSVPEALIKPHYMEIAYRSPRKLRHKGAELERESKVLSSRRAFGLNVERQIRKPISAKVLLSSGGHPGWIGTIPDIKSICLHTANYLFRRNANRDRISNTEREISVERPTTFAGR